MDIERENFEISGPVQLTSMDWKNPNYQRSVAASLVNGVYILDRDRQEKRNGKEELAPPWWEFFHFRVYASLVDEADIFGAIYEFVHPSPDDQNSANDCPRYVIAFRGTSTKGMACLRDLYLDAHVLSNELHRKPRFAVAFQTVESLVVQYGSSNIWLAGHSLGSALVMLVGKHMAKRDVLLKSFLFNPPFTSLPIEIIKDTKVKDGIRFARSVTIAGLAFAMKDKQLKNRPGDDAFVALSQWMPWLFVNPADPICCEYIGYFEQRIKMDEMGFGNIERVATPLTIRGLVMSAMGKESKEPMHLIPCANLIVNSFPSLNFNEAHGLHQWWQPVLLYESKTYQYGGRFFKCTGNPKCCRKKFP